MLALYRSGRQADALRAYQRLRLLLADELGIDPSAELRDLEQRILDQDSSLDLQGPPNRCPLAPVDHFEGLNCAIGSGKETTELSTAPINRPWVGRWRSR